MKTLKFFLFDIFIYFLKFKKINNLFRKLNDLYLINYGYCVDWPYAISKSKNNLFKSEILFIKKLKKINIKNCVDIGANIGDYTIKILNQTNAKVFAFEPMPESFEDLLKIKEKFNQRLEVFNVALSNVKKRITFFMDLAKVQLLL